MIADLQAQIQRMQQKNTAKRVAASKQAHGNYSGKLIPRGSYEHNMVLDQMIDPANAALVGLMNTARPISVSRHHMSVDLNSSSPDCPFSVRLTPNLESVLQTYVRDTEGETRNYQGGQTFTPELGTLVLGNVGGPQQAIEASYLSVSDDVDISESPILEYGQAPYNVGSDANLRFCDGYADGDQATLLFASDKSVLESDGYGVFDIGHPSGDESYSVAIDATFVFTNDATAQATQGSLKIQTSVDGVTWSTAATATANSSRTEVYSIGTTPFPPDMKYWRIRKTTNGIAAGNIARSLTAMTVRLTISDSGVNLNTYTNHPLPSFGPASKLCEAAAVVGATVLVSNMASALDDGGELAAAVRSAATLAQGGTTTFSDLAELPGSYTGPVRTGAFGIWFGAQEEDYFYRPIPYVREESNVVEIAGTFASTNGNVRVEVWLIIAAYTEEPMLCPQVHPYIEHYFDSALSVLSSQPQMVCENPLHPKFIAALKSIGGALLGAAKVASPYLLKQVPVVGDILADGARALMK